MSRKHPAHTHRESSEAIQTDNKDSVCSVESIAPLLQKIFKFWKICFRLKIKKKKRQFAQQRSRRRQMGEGKENGDDLHRGQGSYGDGTTDGERAEKREQLPVAVSFLS
jgi:hypothetical protein